MTGLFVPTRRFRHRGNVSLLVWEELLERIGGVEIVVASTKPIADRSAALRSHILVQKDIIRFLGQDGSCTIFEFPVIYTVIWWRDTLSLCDWAHQSLVRLAVR
jgi:hypothetical protein